MRSLAVTLLMLAIPPSAFAQVGKDSELWQWSEAAEHHKAVVEVKLEGGTGTGVIIHVNRDKPVGNGHQGYCLTAYHVVEEDKAKREIKVRYRDDRVASRCKVVAFDKELDVAILWVWVPSDVEPAKVASTNIKPRERLEYAGLGGGSKLKDLRHFKGKASLPSNSKRIYADVPLLPGDSGGPVFNDNKEVVGVISGGWFWWDGGVEGRTGSKISATWPARSCNTAAVRKLMGKVPDLRSREQLAREQLAREQLARNDRRTAKRSTTTKKLEIKVNKR